MAKRKKSYAKVRRALLAWVKQVRNVKIDRKPLYDVMYIIDTDNPDYLEFRFDSDLYDIINYGSDTALQNKFHKILQRHNGEFETYSVVRFY